MSPHPSAFRRLTALLLAATTCVSTPGLALGQTTEAAPAPALPTAPSPNATVNLIRLMVERGLLPAADAAKLIAQADAEAMQAKAALAAAAQPAPVSDDTVRVTYIPGSVKRQMVEEVRQAVVTEAVQENWATPNTFPDWVSRFKLSGDLRFRYEGDFFPSGGGAVGQLFDFNKINTAAPVSFAHSIFAPVSPAVAPTYNADQDRQRFRLRARLGSDIDLGEGFTGGLRLATGESNSPVSQNQSFGASGGNFSKYSVWLDRAFLKYEMTGKPGSSVTLTIGRMDNPFFGTSMLWSNDLGFDGLVAQGKYRMSDSLTPFLTVGAFPVFNTDLNFGTSSTSAGQAYSSTDKWLYAAQTGVTWEITKDLSAKIAIAFYDFENIEGKVSAPINDTLNVAGYNGPTDSSRPGFAQKGNSYIALRELTYTGTGTYTGSGANYQYFGLATPFREFAMTGRLDYNHFEPLQVSLVGEVVQNLAFDQNDIARNGPTQQSGPQNNLDSSGAFGGGNLGWIVNLQVGAAALQKRWDWNVSLGYRYVESDAVVDGFADSDFGGGGTNLKGYTFGGNLALSSRVALGLRWMSADSIAGPAFKADIIQFDLNAKF